MASKKKHKDATILSFATQKGGSGKSTMTHLVALALKGENLKHDVLVIDADEQQSLTINYNRIKAKYPNDKNIYDLVTKNLNEVRSFIKGELTNYDYILIDLPGTFMADGVRAAFLLADFVFVPVRPSTADVDSFFSVEKLLREVKDQKSKHQTDFEYYFYISIADPKNISTKNLIEFFEKHKLPTLRSINDEDKFAIFNRYEKYAFDYIEPLNLVDHAKEKSDLSFSSFFESVYKIIK